MFREMRRSKQVLSEERTIEVLKNATSGVLSVLGDDDYAYGVPLSYVYHEGKIIFHCAKAGHKLDAIKKNPKVSFCIIDQDQIVPEKYTTYFRSVVVFGIASIIEDVEEQKKALSILAEKYRPEFVDERQAEINKELPAVCMVEIAIQHMTGKEAIELVRARES